MTLRLYLSFSYFTFGSSQDLLYLMVQTNLLQGQTFLNQIENCLDLHIFNETLQKTNLKMYYENEF